MSMSHPLALFHSSYPVQNAILPTPFQSPSINRSRLSSLRGTGLHLCHKIVVVSDSVRVRVALLQVRSYSLLGLGRQTLLNELHNDTIVLRVGLLQVLANPDLNILDLGEVVARSTLARV